MVIYHWQGHPLFLPSSGKYKEGVPEESFSNRMFHYLTFYCFVLQKEIAALKELCTHAGCHEDEIAACKPRRRSKGKAESKYQVSSLSDVVLVCHPLHT